MSPRMTFRTGALLTIGVLAGASVMAPRPGAAAGADAGPPGWLSEVTLNGLLATSYSHNFNDPATQTNQFRVFDFDDRSFKVDELELVAQKAVAKVRDAGFRVDLTVGSSVPRVAASAGLFRDAAGNAEDFDVHQAFGSFIVPAGSGLRIDAGKFITHHGYEVIDGYDGWNDNATRSILFGYAIPFTHVGLRATYAATPRVSGALMVVNGWDVARDNNRAKSVGTQLTLTPRAPLTVLVSGMIGPERTGNSTDSRSLLDLVAILKATSRLTLGANADWGREENAVAPGADANWRGFAGYARWAIIERSAISLRAETFRDLDGVRTGVVQTLSEWTVTPELRITPHLLVRGDLRVDRSNRPVFAKALGVVRTQPTAMVEALYSF
jgi:putative OmpL-like beta-barrel porin-2